MNWKRALVLVTILLFFLGAWSAAAQAGSAITPVHPLIQDRLNRLQDEGARAGYTFKVGYSSAMEKEIPHLCKLKEPTGWLKQAQQTQAAPLLRLSALPDSFDWRTSGTTPIKDQGQCGACWAFGTVAPLESQIKLKCGLEVDLSEQYLVSCNLDGWGCNGGWWAHDYHLDLARSGEQPGAVLESNFPYQASDVPCGPPHQHPYLISNWNYVTGQPLPTVDSIKHAMMTYGPIPAGIHVGPQFQAYKSGIFNANEAGQVNHAITLVGWVNDSAGSTTGYWILRNSWGASWGEGGYMRIRYGCSQVGYSANYIEFACPGTTPAPPPVVSKPDLTGSFTSVATSNAGRRVYGTLKVWNAGNASAGSFNVYLYVSNGSSWTLLGTANVSRGLAAGASTNLTFSMTRTSGTWSQKTLKAVIDPDNKIAESNETNNTITKLIP